MRDAPAWWDLFLDTGVYTGLSNTRVDEAWDDFLRAFWLNSSEEGSIPRDEFYDKWDVEPSLVDWEEWRELKKTP